jgi:hypothetical protein
LDNTTTDKSRARFQIVDNGTLVEGVEGLFETDVKDYRDLIDKGLSFSDDPLSELLSEYDIDGSQVSTNKSKMSDDLVSKIDEINCSSTETKDLAGLKSSLKDKLSLLNEAVSRLNYYQNDIENYLAID